MAFMRSHSSTTLSICGDLCFLKRENTTCQGLKRSTCPSSPLQTWGAPSERRGKSQPPSSSNAPAPSHQILQTCYHKLNPVNHKINHELQLAGNKHLHVSRVVKSKNCQVDPSQRSSEMYSGRLHSICNNLGHITDVGNIAFRRTCDFHSTPAHCSYRLGCVRLSVQKYQSLHWGKMDKEMLQETGGKKCSFYASRHFFNSNHWTELHLSGSHSTGYA